MGYEIPCCIEGAACVQTGFYVDSSKKKGVCQDFNLPCEYGGFLGAKVAYVSFQALLLFFYQAE